MAGSTGTETNYLMQRLAAEPFAFDFFRAVRLLQASQRDLPPVGYSLSPQQDGLRFVQNPSLTFAPSTLESLVFGPDGRPRLGVKFFGLFGPYGPLPPHLTEYAHERKHNFGDPTLVAFANVFHHRLISFFFRAWSASQKAVDMDRNVDRRYPIYVGSLFGIGMESLQDRDPVPDLAKLFFAGRLACPARNAEGLEMILQAFFEIPTRIETFVGQWIDLPAESCCRLGASPDTGSLGLTTIVGSKMWDCQIKFSIRVGPMSLKDYERMLPDGEAFQRLQKWVLNYVGHEFMFDVQLVLRKEEVPDVKLGVTGKLGWTTWMKSAPLPHDADDLVMSGSTN
ncbi:MAG TPA: type VI secretion system baseplate subunit TssG [Methylomirabilota bacterium]|nr:type VI secretion system baseplate subunit TssG [Methylomirabilota bacterium]